MTLKSNLLIAVLTFFGCFLLLALRPVPASSLQNINSITGKIVKVSEDGHSDNVLIKLSNDQHTYSIYHHGTANGFEFEKFRNNLLYRKATLDFMGYRTSLDMFQKIPIARVTVSGQTFWQQPMARFVAN